MYFWGRAKGRSSAQWAWSGNLGRKNGIISLTNLLFAHKSPKSKQPASQNKAEANGGEEVKGSLGGVGLLIKIESGPKSQAALVQLNFHFSRRGGCPTFSLGRQMKIKRILNENRQRLSGRCRPFALAVNSLAFSPRHHKSLICKNYG